jgi:hypothetical protein
MVHLMLLPTINVLYLYISTSRSTCAAPSVAVFCSSLMSCFQGMLFRYFLDDFEMVIIIIIIIKCGFINVLGQS